MVVVVCLSQRPVIPTGTAASTSITQFQQSLTRFVSMMTMVYPDIYISNIEYSSVKSSWLNITYLRERLYDMYYGYNPWCCLQENEGRIAMNDNL